MKSVCRPLRPHHQTAGSRLYNNFLSFDLILSGGYFMDLSLLNVHSHCKASFKKKKKGEKKKQLDLLTTWAYNYTPRLFCLEFHFETITGCNKNGFECIYVLESETVTF